MASDWTIWLAILNVRLALPHLTSWRKSAEGSWVLFFFFASLLENSSATCWGGNGNTWVGGTEGSSLLPLVNGLWRLIVAAHRVSVGILLASIRRSDFCLSMKWSCCRCVCLCVCVHVFCCITWNSIHYCLLAWMLHEGSWMWRHFIMKTSEKYNQTPDRCVSATSPLRPSPPPPPLNSVSVEQRLMGAALSDPLR